MEGTEVRKLAALEERHWWYRERRHLLAEAIRGLEPGRAIDIGAAGGGNTMVLRRAGWRIRYVPAARITHRHSASSDQRSARFHYFNERNRLLMIVRAASAGVVRGELWRFTRSVAGFARLRFQGRRPAQPSEDAGLRLRVLAAVVVRLPRELVARRRIGRLGAQPEPVARA